MFRLKSLSFVALVFAAAIFLIHVNAAAANRAFAPSATFTVNSNLDTNDGACDVTHCTLREAILAANANADADTIEFALGSGTPAIAIGAAGLPTITQPVTINGNTGGATRIELNGTGTPSGIDGLKITGGSTTIRNLVIRRFGGDGIEINTNGSNVVEGCYIGFAADGATQSNNAGDGIYILNSSNNTIGGTTAATRNVITSSGDGIFLEADSGTTTGNIIQGNYIGADSGGTLARGPSGNGMSVYYADSNTIGGTAAGAGNVIVDASGVGVEMFNADSNSIQGNIIGLAANGSTDLGNGSEGIQLSDSSNNTIGGTMHTANTCDGACNVISGNDAEGITIFGVVSTSNNNLIQGNYIGTDKNGTADRGNSDDGIWNPGGANNSIGGTLSGAGNLISGNNRNGIQISGNLATGNNVQGNFIGTNAAGTGALGNSVAGIYLNGGDNNTIGGTVSGARNVISGNFGDGIDIQNTATGNSVQGNYIGVSANGANALGNYDGIYIDSTSNTIGGTDTNARNVISGNYLNGIDLSGAFASGNQIIGNYLGTNANGTGDLGNTYAGILINNAPNNTIGGTTSAHRNVISGNNDAGIDIYQAGATGNVVQGNYIGTQSDGTSALGNSYVGIWLEGGASNNSIGGTASGAGNVIAFNANDGVLVESGTGNQIRRNSIFSNDGLGIDLDTNGVTANDASDSDTGANNRQNFPVLASAQQGSTRITGTFNSTPNTSFTLEFFSAPTADATGNGEGKTYLCDTSVTTNGSGDAPLDVTCATTTPAGNVVTATATRNSAPFDTSEFSNAVTVTAPTALVVSEFSGSARNGRVQLAWTTANELNVLGFNLWRGVKSGNEIQLNAEPVPAQNPGQLISNFYSFEDANVRAGKTYTYRLEVLLANGASEWVEPVQVKIPNDADACAGKLKPVKLLTPQNGETVQTRRVALDWSDNLCATSYSLVLRRGGAGGKIVEQVENVTTSAYVTIQLKRGETYSWSVRACNASKCSRARSGEFRIALE